MSSRGFLFGSGSRTRGSDARRGMRYGQTGTTGTASGTATASGRYGSSSRPGTRGAGTGRPEDGAPRSGRTAGSAATRGSTRLGLPSHEPGSSKPLRAAASFRVDTRSPTSVGSGSPAMGSMSSSMRRAASFRERGASARGAAAPSGGAAGGVGRTGGKLGLTRSGTSRSRTLGGVRSGGAGAPASRPAGGTAGGSHASSRSGTARGGTRKTGHRADPGGSSGAAAGGGGGRVGGGGTGAGAGAGRSRAGGAKEAGGGGSGGGKSGGSSGGSSAAKESSKASGGLVRRTQLEFSLRDLRLEKTVGTGTFGRVRVVFHRRKKKYYALKILKKSEVIRLKQVDHIRNEVRIMSCIDHPFVVNLVGYIQDRKRIYMLLEYVPGGELFTHLRAVEKFSSDAAKFYSAEIALAFEHLHSFNVIYRDLKPENLLISKRGHIKITDFGFAKVVRAGESTYTLCGTPEYLAPEIIQSKGHDRAVDWWALGILIYEMLAGYPPYFDESPFGIYQKILAGRLSFTRDFSDNARDLVRRLLNPDRTRRLGCLRDGAADIKKHRWFARVSWDGVRARSIPPPFIPKVTTENDTTNFEDYSDSDDDTARELSAKEARLFADMDDF